MTVTYGNQVANVRLGGFGKMLLKWRGSVYKLFWREFLIWSALYTLISISYRHLARSHPDSELKTSFDQFCLQVNRFTDMIPMSFILGFYVSIVVSRWWAQYMNIAWPDRCMMVINLYVRHHKTGDGTLVCNEMCKKCDLARRARRKLIRWLNLAAVLTFRDVSFSVKERFPTMDHIVSAGFMTEDEREYYEYTKTIHLKYWIPFIWFVNTLVQLKQTGYVYSEYALNKLIDEMNAFRGCCGMLQSYDWISIPLVYTQVVCVAVYGFFLSCLFGRQYLVPSQNGTSEGLTPVGSEFDGYVPVYTLLQFFFYMGWLKVAEQLINPFGSDDDDFDMNLIIDRNLEVSFLAIDSMSTYVPPDVRDIWEDRDVAEAPYTQASAEHKKAPFLGSTANLSQNEQTPFIPMDSLFELTGRNRDAFSGDFLSSMASLGRNSVRRRNLSRNYDSVRKAELNSNATDSHQEIDKRSVAELDGNPVASMQSMHSHWYGSGSTYSRHRIINPYAQPSAYTNSNKATYSPQCSIDMATRGPQMDPDRIPLLQSDGSRDSKESDHSVLIKAGDPVGSPECEVRIIEAVQPDGKEIQIEVPAPPAPENEENNLPPTTQAHKITTQNDVKTENLIQISETEPA